MYARFQANGTEQDAFAEYMYANFRTNPYVVTDTDLFGDSRIQLLNVFDFKNTLNIDKCYLQHVNYSEEQFNSDYKKIIQGRSFLQLPLNLFDDKIDTPHIDLFDKHLVILYYVTDADGDTVIYKNKYSKKDPIPFFDDLQESKRVTPKQGRVVLFDGSHWHTSCQPKEKIRCIINYNVVDK
jgi:hypothetical protein